MGKPSDKRHNARRMGKSERARVKKPFRSVSGISVGGVGTVQIVAGRKKYVKVSRYIDGLLHAARHRGDSLTAKSKGNIKRPLYKIEPFTTHLQ